MKAPTQSIIEDFTIRYRHRIYFTRNVFDLKNSLLASTLVEICKRERPRILVVADHSLLNARTELREEIYDYFDQHQREVELSGLLELPGGEHIKNDSIYLNEVYKAMDTQRLCRHSCVIALGGGSILDMVGYAAATAHRGVRHLRLPTTSLSQGDGGCGVKNSINAFTKKNFIGTFTPPDAVINDLFFLETLPYKVLKDGFIEAVKVALIKDREFFDYIETNADALIQRNPEIVQKVIETSARLHVHHITRNGDPFELTSSRPLDFGHWSAHKLEALSDFSISHGDAVAVGVALDCLYSNKLGMLPEESLQRILILIQQLGFRIFNEHLTDLSKNGNFAIIDGLEEFREHLGGRLTIPLLSDIGDQIETHEMNVDILKSCIFRFCERKDTLKA